MAAKYTPDILAKTEWYIRNYHGDEDGGKGDVYPSIAGLARHLDVSGRTVTKWREDPEKPEFTALIDELWTEAERVLINGGIEKTFAPNFAEQRLKEIHNKLYRERASDQPPESVAGQLEQAREKQAEQEAADVSPREGFMQLMQGGKDG